MNKNQNPNPGAALIEAATSLAGFLKNTRNPANRVGSADLTEPAPSTPEPVQNLKETISKLDHAALIQVVKEAENLYRKVQALQVYAANEVARRETLCLDHGHKNPRSFLQTLTLAPGADISARLKLGEAITPPVAPMGETVEPKFSEIEQALENGSINLTTAGTIVKALSKLDSHVTDEEIQTAEEHLVKSAIQGLNSDVSGRKTDRNADKNTDSGTGSETGELLPFHADNIRTLSEGWRDNLQKGGQPTTEEQQARRYFYIGRQKDGLVPVKGLLLPEIAAKLGRAIDAITNPRVKKKPSFKAVQPKAVQPETMHAETETLYSDETRDIRTPDQKRHDAVAIAISFALKNEEMPQLGGEAVSLVIETTEKELQKQNGTAWIQNAHGENTRVSAAAARHASCLAGITRVTLNENGKITQLSIQARIFNATQRKAIHLRDGGCIIPGCTTPSAWCEVHHVTEYQEGGKTHVNNGVLLCWYHHRHIEQNGWSVRMKNGLPEVRAPQWMDPKRTWRPHRPLHKAANLATKNSTRERAPA